MVARAAAKPSLVLAIVCTGVVLSSLDLFIVNVALPSIARDLRTGSLGGVTWVLNAYAIVFAALLVLAGRLADRSGQKPAFLLGVAVFTAASAACAASTSLSMLVAFRVVQAAGAAVLVPTSLALVLAAYPPERRGGAVRTWTAMGGAAAAVGPVVGGLLVAQSWRWIFLVNLPIGIGALIVGARRLPDVRGDRGPWPDAAGAALLTAAITGLTFALLQGNAWGWSSWRVTGLFAAAMLAGTAFFWRSARHPRPILDLDLLRTRSFAVATFATLLFSTAFGAMLLAAMLWTQDVWHWSALRAGLSLVPGPLMVPLWSAAAGPLIRRFGPGRVITLGCTVFAAGLMWLAAAIGLQPHYVSEMLGGTLLTGIGVGLTLPTLYSTAAAALPPERFATGSAVVSMVRQIGFALGVATLVAVLGSPTSAHGQLSAFEQAWVVISVLSLAAAGTGFLLRTQHSRPEVNRSATPATREAARP